MAFEPECVLGLDFSPIAVAAAKRKVPQAAVVRADLCSTLPFADASIDAVTILNVLYHQWVKSEHAVLREVERILKPSGLAIFTEPAFPFLMRAMDAGAMTRRRYFRTELEALCRENSLDVCHSSYFTSFGFIILCALKLWNKIRRRSNSAVAPDMKPISPFLNNCLLVAARFESRVIELGVKVPFGTTIICVCRKRAFPA